MALCPEKSWYAKSRHTTIQTPGSCGIDLDDGPRCGKPTVEGSPVDICPQHALTVFHYLSRLVGERPADRIDGVGRAKNIPLARLRNGRVRGSTCGELERLSIDIMNGWSSVVYYLLVDEYIKIGFSTNIAKRVRFYPPSATIVALEPGGRAVELARHRQFAHLIAARSEWFSPGDDLVAHIRELDEYGLPMAPVRRAIEPA